MVSAIRSCQGASCKFTGSGGCLLVLCASNETMDAVFGVCMENNFSCERVKPHRRSVEVTQRHESPSLPESLGMKEWIFP